jgi:glycerophosphoryl diester phosphodiesterase
MDLRLRMRECANSTKSRVPEFGLWAVFRLSIASCRLAISVGAGPLPAARCDRREKSQTPSPHISIANRLKKRAIIPTILCGILRIFIRPSEARLRRLFGTHVDAGVRIRSRSLLDRKGVLNAVAQQLLNCGLLPLHSWLAPGKFRRNQIVRLLATCETAIMPTRIIALTVLLLLPALTRSQDKPGKSATGPAVFRIDAKTPQGLMELLRYTGEPTPMVSGHRGGAGVGFPENCIATFEHTLEHTFAMLEVDPRFTKDGAIVLHHDPSLERTTTGKGLVAEHTLAELKQLRLKDIAGNVTEHRIPTLDEALEWARGKAVLVLDQKDVPVAARVKKIEEHKAEAYAMLIVMNFKDVQACYALNPNVMMEVMIANREKAAEFDKLGVPWKNVVAFVGHIPPEDAALYEAIHAKGACCMIGTSRNLDRQVNSGKVADIKQLDAAYHAFLSRGADLIETDIPAQLGPLLYATSAIPAAKREYLRVK